MEPAAETLRLSKLMSERGICSRREADEYIARGWVFVDGVRVSELGTKVLPSVTVKLDRAAVATQSGRMTVLLNKPIGYVSSQPEPGYQPAIVLIKPENQLQGETIEFKREHLKELAPAGRLDIDSTGLV